MADQPSDADATWLPPRAPGAEPAPRFEPQAHHGWQPPHAPAPPAPPAPPATPSAPRPQRPASGGPTFVKGGTAGDAVAAAPRNRLALAALSCGIAGLGLLVVSLGLWFAIALPLSAAAWVCGARARRRLADGRASTGAGQARAGLVLGVIGVALGVVAAAVWIYLLASGVSLEDIQQDLERELERQRESDGDGAVQALSSLWRA